MNFTLMNLVKRYMKDSKMRKNYENYKLDCLFLKKKPVSYSEFKEIYKNKEYTEENLF